MNEKTFEEALNEKGVLFYKTVGVSMRPLIRQGRDCVCIVKRPEERLKKNDVAFFKRPLCGGGPQYVLHRVLRVNPDGTYWIVGDNCTEGETVKEENILGVLSLIKRKGKTVRPADLSYRLYVRLWCEPYRFRFFILKYKGLPRRIAGKLLGWLK